MFRKIIAIVTVLLAAPLWGISFDFVESHAQVGWLIGYCLISVIIGAFLISLLRDWAFPDEFDDIDPIDPAASR